MPRRRTSRFLLLAACLAAFAGCGQGKEPAPDKVTISIVIPYRPGGGFDRSVRAFAPYFAREIGAGVTILPENIPGAGGRRGAVTVYRARPDGTTLGIFNLPGVVLPEVLGERLDYNLRDMSWIGQLESQYYVLLVAADSDWHSLDDIRAAAEVSFVSTGYGSSSLAASQILAKRLQLADPAPIFLAGYAGTADYLVGLIRGDGNLALAPVSSATEYIESGDLRPIAVAGSSSTIDNVPTFAELGLPDMTTLGLQRSVAGPPDMDAERLAALRAAFLRAAADPAFQKAAANAHLDLSPLDGETTALEVAKSFSFYAAFKTDLGNPNAL